jgi:hypothetical protein
VEEHNHEIKPDDHQQAEFGSVSKKILGTAMAWATALKKMSRICRFWSLWFDVTVEPGLIQLRTEPKRRNDDALHGDS